MSTDRDFVKELQDNMSVCSNHVGIVEQHTIKIDILTNKLGALIQLLVDKNVLTEELIDDYI